MAIVAYTIATALLLQFCVSCKATARRGDETKFVTAHASGQPKGVAESTQAMHPMPDDAYQRLRVEKRI